MNYSFLMCHAKWILGLVVFILLASCGEAPPSNEELVLRFKENVPAAEELEQMILNDAVLRKSKTYSIGTDRIGKYWEILTNKWSKEGDEVKLSLIEVLQKESLSQARYDRYISLLYKLNAERISVSLDEMNNHLIAILIF